MQKLNWDNFGLKSESKQKSFEDLCMFLLCRELKITKIEAYQNQPGIETEPFEINGKKCGFQAKFFDSKFEWQQIKMSILGAENGAGTNFKDKYPNNVFEKYKVDKVYLYSNKCKTLQGRKRTKAETLIVNVAREYKSKVIYISEKEIFLKLISPSNLDLAQLYFGVGDEYGFIKNSVNIQISTFLQSSEYIDIPILKENKKISLISNDIMAENSKEFILLGNPGSGKTILMHRLLEIFGGLDKGTVDDQMHTLTKNNAIPILVNLKNCIIDSLENIIRGRKHDFRVNEQDLNCIYVFDGLDELDEKIADNVLYQIYELSQKGHTAKIIISCRTGNINRLKVKTYFENIIEYKIADLDYSYINIFFNKRDIKNKKQKLKYLKKNNEELVSKLKDILLIKLLWDTIEELDEKSTILDLFDKRINMLLNSPSHKKDIENLNILNPKCDMVIKLNQEIAYEFQKKFQFRFSLKELQSLIMSRLPRLDYKAINLILNYIADLFFESTYSNDTSKKENTYIYQHRMYQEYFFAQKLKNEYEKNPKIIRELKIISNKDYFENFFLKYLQREYEKYNNLPGCIEINLIKVYLKKQRGVGADDAYYMNSKQFIPALVSQVQNIFNELLEKENLKLWDKLTIDINQLVKQFILWEKDKNDYRTINYLKRIYEDGISTLLENIVLFWKANKKDAAKTLIRQFETVLDLYDEKEFIKNLHNNEKKNLTDPFWDQIESLIYFKITIKNEKTQVIFNNFIRKNYKYFTDNKFFNFEESGKEKLVKSFFRVCLDVDKVALFELINTFDEYEFIAFLDLIKTMDYLPIFIRSKSIHNKIKSFILNFTQELNEKNIFLLFYKKYFNISLTQNETEIAEQELKKIREGSYYLNKIYINFAILSYVLDQYSFMGFLENLHENRFRYYNELGLYAALYSDYIKLIGDEKKIEPIVRDYIRYLNFYTERPHYGQHLNIEISFLWAFLFTYSKSAIQILLNMKNVLLKDKNNIVLFSFYQKLSLLNFNLFNQIVNRSELDSFEDELLKWKDDFYSYVDRCFDLSRLYSKRSTQKAKYIFEKGIIDGILRHGWRNDIIVSYQLVEALEILWRNNWESNETLKEYSKKVFSLTLRVSNITDGKGTWQGPYNVIKLVAAYDLELAEKFKKKFIKENDYNFSNIVITDVLKAKVKFGFSIKDIEYGMNEFKKEYGYQGKVRADYFEEKFIVYLQILENDLYTDEEKKYAFEKMYEIVNVVNEQRIEYFLSNSEFTDTKLQYRKLCEKYNKQFILELDNNNNILKREKNISEEKFIKKVKSCTTKKQLIGKYKILNNFNYKIILTRYESWECLVEKTITLTNGIILFINYLKNNYFPQTDFFTDNSDYFHFGVAVALKNINTRSEMMNYILKNIGNSGFINIMKVFEVLDDKDMCLRLFNRYLKFCELIVN